MLVPIRELVAGVAPPCRGVAARGPLGLDRGPCGYRRGRYAGPERGRFLLKRLEDRKIHVELSDRARELLVREGYDPAYGARPLKRTIQKLVLDPLARRVLEGEFGEGDTVTIHAEFGALVFRKAAVAAPA